MKLYLTRHGQTRLNALKLMQGRTDEPLNEKGIAQAQSVRELLSGVNFDAVYASPLQRAVKTASIISGVPEQGIIKDERIIEADFGIYEARPYSRMGLRMSLYWALPELFPAPPSAETIASMVERSSAFLRELGQAEHENVLIVCHGGIIRALRGCLEGRPRGIRWRPKPRNCEVSVYELHGSSASLTEIISGEII